MWYIMQAMHLATVLVVAVVVGLSVAGAAVILATPRRRTARIRPYSRVGTGGLPPGRIVYSDAEGNGVPLVARRYPLMGKPDYVVLGADGHRVPIEIKSAHVRGEPRHEDVLQLVTYMIILDDLYKPSPRYGLLRYANAAFEVPYTQNLRAEVLALVAEMQALEGIDDEPPAGTPSSTLCRGCAFRAFCEDAAV